MSKEKVTINAVHERDLKGLMQKVGLWEAYQKGELRCVCGKVLDEETLAGFKKVNGEVKAFCLLDIVGNYNSDIAK